MIQLFNKTQSKISSIVVAFNAGARMEGSRKFNSGLAHMLEHSIFKGTDKRTCEQINEEVAMMGGSINAFTSHEMVAYFLDVPYDKLEDGMELMSDIILNSKIPNDEFEKEKKVVLEEEASSYDDIDSYMFRNFSELFFSNYLKNPVIGTQSSISKFTAEEVREFYKKFCSKDQIILSVSSNHKKKDVKDIMIKYFGQANGKIRKKSSFGKPNEYGGLGQVLTLTRPGIEHSYVWVCFPGLTKNSKHKAAMSVMSSVLGGGMDSRLFKEIREKRGLAYSVYCASTEFQTAGAFMICFSSRDENINEIIELVSLEISKIKENLVEEKELQKIKNKKRTAYYRSIEDGFTICMNNISQKLFSSCSLEKFDSMLQSVSIEDIKDVANKIFKTDPLIVICKGDSEESGEDE